MAPVLKTGIVRNKKLSRVRIPLSPFVFARFLLGEDISFLTFAWLFSTIKGNGSAKWDSRARKKKWIRSKSKERKKNTFYLKYDPDPTNMYGSKIKWILTSNILQTLDSCFS